MNPDHSPAVWYANLKELEQILGLPDGFIESLFEEDDWSFVVKTHALLEACISDLLVNALDPRAEEVVRRMNIGGGRTGKLALTKALELLDESHIRLIGRFSDLRNRVIHDIKQISFNFAAYIQELPGPEQMALARDVALVIPLEGDPELVDAVRHMLKLQAKPVLALATMAILAHTLFRLRPDELERANQAAIKGKGDRALAILIIVLVALTTQQKKASTT